MIRIQAGTASSDKCLVCRHCKQVRNESHSASDSSSIASSQKRNRSQQDPNTTGTRDYSQTQTIQYKSMPDRIMCVGFEHNESQEKANLQHDLQTVLRAE